MNTVKAMRSVGAKTGGRVGLGAAARQLGLDPAELGAEAEAYWSMLNDLSESNPDEYRQFIDKQLREAQEAERAPRRRGFRPKAGLAVQSAYTSGGRGPVAVNLTSFPGVEMPVDAAGVAVRGDARSNLAGLSIPVAVSPLREVAGDGVRCGGAETIFVVDVVFNPWVLAQAREFSSFRAQLVELALTWAESELRGKLSRKYRDLEDAYVGWEEGPEGRTEAFFEVKGAEHDQEQGKGRNEEEGAPEKGGVSALEAAIRDRLNPQSSSTTATTSSPRQSQPPDLLRHPEDLLGALRQGEAAREAEHAAPKLEELLKKMADSHSVGGGTGGGGFSSSNKSDELGGFEGNSKHKPAAAKIEEIKPSVVEVVPPPAVPPAARSAGGAVKKGFLDKLQHTGPLYPNGSSEGKATSMYQKSKIVDLNKLSPEEVQKVMLEHAGPQHPPPQQQQQQRQQQDHASSSTAVRDILNDSMQAMSARDKDAFLRLAEAADAELGALNVTNAGAANDDMGGLFGDMAKLLGTFGLDPSVPPPAAIAPAAPRARQAADTPKQESPTLTPPADAKAAPEAVVTHGEHGLITVQLRMPLVKSMMEVDVEISERKIRLAANKHYAERNVVLPRTILKDSARAKFSAKTGTLTVTASARSHD